MATRWLTVKDISDVTGKDEQAIRADVARRKFQAPHRFRGNNRNAPVWPRDVLGDNPDEESGSTKMSRELHLARLLDEVRWWVWENGSAAIPQHAVGRVDSTGRAFPIGVRVSALRAAYKAGRLDKEEAAEFESLPGWQWNHWETIWRSRFAEVLVHHKAGQLTSRDRAWLAHQRRRWSKLNPACRELFDAYPGLIDVARQSRVEEFVVACEQWLKDHPGRTLYAMPYAATVFVDGEKIPVGRRATYYRRRYLGMEGSRRLSAADATKIERLPGWTWEMSSTHVEAQRRKASA